MHYRYMCGHTTVYVLEHSKGFPLCWNTELIIPHKDLLGKPKHDQIKIY